MKPSPSSSKCELADHGRDEAGIADAEPSAAAHATQVVHGVAMGLRCLLAHLASELPSPTVRLFHPSFPLTLLAKIHTFKPFLCNITVFVYYHLNLVLADSPSGRVPTNFIKDTCTLPQVLFTWSQPSLLHGFLSCYLIERFVRPLFPFCYNVL